MSETLLNQLAAHGDTWCLDMSRLPQYMGDDRDERHAARRFPKMDGRVAVIPVHGVLTKRGGWMAESTDRIGAAVNAAADHKGIAGIVLDIDSPGGSTYGQLEFGELIYQARDKKPIAAVANPLAASAAYWTAAAASRIAVTPSGDVGHIGVWSLHLDHSKMLDEIGIKPTFVYAGEHKVDGNFYEPLTDSARASMQASVDEAYRAFTDGVAKMRGISKVKAREMGDGRIHSADAALTHGFVDRVSTLEQVLHDMGAREAITSGHDVANVSDAHRMLMRVWEGHRADGIQQEYIDAHEAERKRKRK